MQMFSSTRKVEAGPVPSEEASATMEKSNGAGGAPHTGGYLSSGVSITGTVKFKKELLIDGQVEGEIDCTGKLTIGEHANIRGQIRARSVVVTGHVDGDITAEERCELRAGCVVNGDIEAPRLVVDEAAAFVGSAKIASKKL